MKATVLLAAAMLTACASNSPPRAILGDPAVLSANDLCQAWAQKPLTQANADYQTSAWQEIVKRGLFNQKQVETIRAGLLEVGMPEAAALCAWGRPRRSATLQMTPTLNERMYRRTSYEAGGVVSVYVYTCNAVITVIQTKRGNARQLARDCRS